ncbi:unnamed protein product [Rhizophagus irregularis]|nr:unnamed protein product [Rhizophagus irregularis]
MSTITLSCLVVGENPYENAFTIKFIKSEAVSELRKAIKEEIDDNVKAKDLKLWKVDISLEEENEKLDLVNTKINVNIKEELGALKARLRTCFTFPDGTEDKHIVINRECGSEKEIICLADDEDLAT